MKIGIFTSSITESAAKTIKKTLENSGIHIFRIDLYDAAKDGGIITYTFNISTQNPFGYFFIFSIAAGAIGLFVLIGYIYLPKLLRARSKSQL